MMPCRSACVVIVVIVFVYAALQPTPASAETPARSIDVEDPSGKGRKALDQLHEALRQAQAKKGRARLLFYGDSHIARDHYTGQLRRRLQERFGDAGAGFAPIADPFDHYRHQDLVIAPRGRWKQVRVLKRQRDAYGIFGVALDATGEAHGYIEPKRSKGTGGRATLFDLLYLEQPGGGTIEVDVDGGTPKRIATVNAKRIPAFERFKVRDGPHTLNVRAVGDGPVRVFGASVERMRPGVIVDTLGIPGARARDQIPWDIGVQRAHLQRLSPHLFVLAYGSNEAIGERLSMAQYERELRTVVTRFEKALPRSSCLLIGPSDLPMRQPDGSFGDRPRVKQIIAIQRKVAADHGCGFFDLVAFQGGHGSMPRWVKHVPPLAREDHTHFTKAGHTLIAAALERALLKGL